jgi:hypothetical protein
MLRTSGGSSSYNDKKEFGKLKKIAQKKEEYSSVRKKHRSWNS